MGDGKANPLLWTVVLLTVAIIGVSQPIVSRLVDIYWPTTPNVDFTIPEGVINTPEQAVIDYWDNVDNSNFQIAWQSLSPEFQQREHESNYDDYVEGYAWIKPCSVKATNVVLSDRNNATAKVTAHVMYEGTECTGDYKFEHFLLFDGSTKVWLLDSVVNPER